MSRSTTFSPRRTVASVAAAFVLAGSLSACSSSTDNESNDNVEDTPTASESSEVTATALASDDSTSDGESSPAATGNEGSDDQSNGTDSSGDDPTSTTAPTDGTTPLVPPTSVEEIPENPGYVRTETEDGPYYSVRGAAAYFEGDSEPSLYALVPPEIVNNIPEGSPPIVIYGDYVWEGVISGDDTTDDDLMWWKLGSGDGGNICGADCDVFPTDQQISIVVQMLGDK